MSEVIHSQRPPSSSELVNTNEDQLYKQPPPYYSSIPTAPIIPAVSYRFADEPMKINCQFCGHPVTTVIEERNGMMPFILCIVLLVSCWFCGCCLIPFCVSGIKDKIHHCPICQREVGKKIFL